jgi:DNA-binding XRE family transcriptional regulator
MKSVFHEQLIGNQDEAMNLLRLDMHNMDAGLLATRIGVSVSCIYAIRSGRTKWPRHETMFAICRVLGWQIIMRRV